MKKYMSKVFFLLLLLITSVFVACSIQIKYKVEFYVDGVIYDTIGSDGESISMPSDPSKPGYDFDGWFYDEDSWEEPFTLQSLLDQALSEENVIKLYAKFSEQAYDFQVSLSGFEKNGDEFVIEIGKDVTEFDVESCLILGKNLTYVLSESEDFSNPISSGVAVLREGANIFYLKVTNEYGQYRQYALKFERKDSFSVKFDTQGGTQIAEQWVESGATARVPTEIPKKYGYVFLKWDFDFTAPITQSTTIRAVWKENFYTVQYSPNGGSGEVQESIVEPNAVFSLPCNAFDRDGYTFVGWRLGDRLWEEGDEVVDLATVGERVCFLAEWEANRYVVQFAKGDASATGTTPSQSFVYDAAQNLTANGFLKQGYAFDGWVYNGKKYADAEIVRNLAEGGTITLTATWRPFEFILRYEGNGATYGEAFTQNITYDSDFTVRYSLFERRGYSFLHWETQDGTELEAGDEYSANIFMADGSARDGQEIVLNAVWQANEYMVEYRMYNMGWFYPQTVFYDEEFALAECPSFFEEEGYVFDGWSVPGYGICQAGDIVKNLTTEDSVKVYAQWREVRYTLRFDVLDGECEPLEDAEATYDDTIYFTRQEPVKEGYTFVGYHYKDIYLGKTGHGVRNLTNVDGDVLTLRALYRYEYDGDGSAENPYILDTPESVTALSDYMMIDAFEYDGKDHNAHFRLAGDIDLQGAAISPICDISAFRGVIDGGLFTISNFELRAGLKGYAESYLGFISENYGTVRYLRLQDFKVSADGSVPYIGCVVGKNSGFIDYCEVVGAEIIASTHEALEQMMIGGYVGTVFNSVEMDSRVNGCKFSGSFSIDADNVLSLRFGGMVGDGINTNLKYCVIDYTASIFNADYVTANTVAPSYNLTSDAISTLATVDIAIAANHITLNIQPTDVSHVYYSDESSISLYEDGAEIALSGDFPLVEKSNFADFDWVYENVTGFNLASWEFDGENAPFVSKEPTKPLPQAIASAQDLLALSGKQASGIYYLTSDIDLGGVEWIPFDLYGVLDGKGHKIYNFAITTPTSNKTASFIGENHGEILSLYLSDYSILITPDKIIGNPYTIYAGGLVAYNYGTIKFVKADGYIDIEMPTNFPNSKNAVVGGLVAVNTGDIYSSYVDANITVYSGKTLKIGGIAAIGDGGQIVNCYTTGSMAGQSHDDSSASGGGIVGQSGAYQYTIVKNSFSFCTIRLFGNKYSAQVNTIAEYTENCYSALSQKIYYNGQELIFADLSIVDDVNLKSASYLRNKLKFGGYVDAATLETDFTKAWIFQDNELPKLYYEIM